MPGITVGLTESPPLLLSWITEKISESEINCRTRLPIEMWVNVLHNGLSYRGTAPLLSQKPKTNLSLGNNGIWWPRRTSINCTEIDRHLLRESKKSTSLWMSQQPALPNAQASALSHDVAQCKKANNPYNQARVGIIAQRGTGQKNQQPV